MTEKEAIEHLKHMHYGIDKLPYDCEMNIDIEAVQEVLQLLEQKDNRIDELEKAFVDEDLKHRDKINKVIDKLKEDIKNNKSGINFMDLRCIGKWQEANEILNILEE